MLTNAECKNATCPLDKNRARLACSGGLYLEVSPAGSKRWFWKYRKDGKEGRMALGSYPDVCQRRSVTPVMPSSCSIHAGSQPSLERFHTRGINHYGFGLQALTIVA